MIVRPEGYLITNNHAISAASTAGTIDIVFSDGRSVEAKLVGRDPESDLAVLQVTADKDLPTDPLGDSSKVLVGQPVVALGAPLGLSSSVTAGIVSLLGRDVPVPSDNGTTATLVGALQTEASINPGKVAFTFFGISAAAGLRAGDAVEVSYVRDGKAATATPIWGLGSNGDGLSAKPPGSLWRWDVVRCLPC
ncbi:MULTISPECIES: S1C family serine protease [Arthrobacter]|uniref:S1C family serine protease n=1 Tax=Arthrobacter TaxID=1663 RepID=UPI000784D74E|nr:MULTISPECIES: trypsin-like peptidase domain-containing protein [Arthrobacter]